LTFSKFYQFLEILTFGGVLSCILLHATIVALVVIALAALTLALVVLAIGVVVLIFPSLECPFGLTSKWDYSGNGGTTLHFVAPSVQIVLPTM
jgi:hypothetical protein